MNRLVRYEIIDTKTGEKIPARDAIVTQEGKVGFWDEGQGWDDSGSQDELTVNVIATPDIDAPKSARSLTALELETICDALDLWMERGGGVPPHTLQVGNSARDVIKERIGHERQEIKADQACNSQSGWRSR